MTYSELNSGDIFSLKDSIVQIRGLDSVTSGEMVLDSRSQLGLVLNLASTTTGIIMFHDQKLMAGDRLERKHHTLMLSVDINIHSNVYNPLGTSQNIVNKLSNLILSPFISIFGTIRRYVEVKAPNIISRQPVHESLSTGIIGIDGVVPLGWGQRELIIGDRQTGKTTIAMDIVINQAVDSPLLKQHIINTVDVLIQGLGNINSYVF